MLFLTIAAGPVWAGAGGEAEVEEIRVVGTTAAGSFLAPSANALLIAAILEWRRKAGESAKPGPEFHGRSVNPGHLEVNQ